MLLVKLRPWFPVKILVFDSNKDAAAQAYDVMLNTRDDRDSFRVLTRTMATCDTYNGHEARVFEGHAGIASCDYLRTRSAACLTPINAVLLYSCLRTIGCRLLDY